MRVILLGEPFDDYDGEYTGVPERLKTLAGANRVVVICHGMPWKPYEGKYRIHPELMSINLHALLLAQSGDAAATVEVQRLAEHFAGKCERVFGLATGWNELANSGMDGEVLDFLQSDEVTPRDREVQRLLGFDLPVTRLALRVALEIAAEELGGGRGGREGSGLPPEVLLAPALELARREPSLAEWAGEIEGSLGDQEGLRATVGRALDALVQN